MQQGWRRRRRCCERTEGESLQIRRDEWEVGGRGLEECKGCRLDERRESIERVQLTSHEGGVERSLGRSGWMAGRLVVDGL
eukprot:2433505-Rhodomonas_salina.1